MKTTEQLEIQAKVWGKLSIIAPIFFTLILAVVYWFSLLKVEILFYIACGLYFGTAIIWWWWTMHSIVFLTRLLVATNKKLEKISIDIIDLRKEIN